MGAEEGGLEGDPGKEGLTMPAGESRRLVAKEAGSGVGRAVLAAATPGVYRVTDGALTALATKGVLNPLEFRDLRASAGKVQAAAKASGGGVHWIAKGIPDFRRTRPGRDSHGRGWAGLVANRSLVVSGLVQAPLLL